MIKTGVYLTPPQIYREQYDQATECLDTIQKHINREVSMGSFSLDEARWSVTQHR